MNREISRENEEDIATELADLMDKVGAFYDDEMKGYECIANVYKISYVV